ncbi:hypothetical protein F2Q69_00022661 [Brassica cretica]|uniref:Uncharacterized protein n=1 Tax=Brassica cretica TaxID=69181 RepID=A0A8S9Q0H6_BRACR|nr:hypothetical protein F2Q69_00022661 [Brassica cretica]
MDTEPRDMDATLILIRDDKGNLHDQEGHLRNAAVQRIDAQGAAIPDGEGREAARRRFQSRKSDEFRQITLLSIDANPRTSIDRGHPKSIDVLSWISIDNTYGINRILKSHEDHDSRGVRSKTPTSAQPCLPEYEKEYLASIETHTATSIDCAQQKSTDAVGEESVDIRQGEWENDYYIPTMATHTMHTEEYDKDYEEERAIEQRATLDEEDRLLQHSSWKQKSPSIDRYG